MNADTLDKALPADELNQIKQVYTDVEHHAALPHVLPPRHPPAQRRRPFQRNFSDSPEPSGVHDFPDAADRRIQPDLVCDAQQHLRIGAGFHHFPGFCMRHRKRLFAQDVFSGASGREHRRMVHDVRKRDVDDVDVRVGEEVRQIRMLPRHVELICERRGFLRAAAQAGCDLGYPDSSGWPAP